MRSKLLKFSLCQAVISVLVFVVDYFFYHYFTLEGFCREWQSEPVKPFVTQMIGILGTLFFFGACVTLLATFIFFNSKESEEHQ